MARLYARWTHYYTHFDEKGRLIEYVFPAGEAREVPDDVAALLTAAHPQKLVSLRPGEEKPAEEQAPDVYETREIEEPQGDRMMKPKRRSRR